jgi:UDP-N-acetylmuramate dehydrogenase
VIDIPASLNDGLLAGRVVPAAPLAGFTTFKCGGEADWLFEARTTDELVLAVRAARTAAMPLTVLGGGSNVLVGDRGIRGLVVRTVMSGVRQDEADVVKAEAGLTTNGLVRWTIARGLGALEAWAGTPGRVGGAIAGNAHYGGRTIGELVTQVRVVSRDGEVTTVDGGDMEFGYDRSRLQRTSEILLWAAFRVRPLCEPARLREVARQSLADRKRTQPLDGASAGCVFQNPDLRVEPIPDGVPASAGALIDRAGLKGRRIGAARVSDVHANFIVNDGGASSAEIRALIDLCRQEVQARFGVTLREEIRYLGEF